MEGSQDSKGWEGGVAGELLVGEGMLDESSSGDNEADMPGVAVVGVGDINGALDSSGGAYGILGKPMDDSDVASNDWAVISSRSNGPSRGIDELGDMGGNKGRSVAVSGDGCAGAKGWDGGDGIASASDDGIEMDDAPGTGSEAENMAAGDANEEDRSDDPAEGSDTESVDT